MKWHRRVDKISDEIEHLVIWNDYGSGISFDNKTFKESDWDYWREKFEKA